MQCLQPQKLTPINFNCFSMCLLPERSNNPLSPAPDGLRMNYFILKYEWDARQTWAPASSKHKTSLVSHISKVNRMSMNIHILHMMISAQHLLNEIVSNITSSLDLNTIMFSIKGPAKLFIYCQCLVYTGYQPYIILHPALLQQM